jgi:hypothetical protein
MKPSGGYSALREAWKGAGISGKNDAADAAEVTG